MPKVVHREVRERQKAAGLTDAEMARLVGRSVSWWRGFLGDLWPAPLSAAIVVSKAIGLPLDAIRWSHEHRPDEPARSAPPNPTPTPQG